MRIRMRGTRQELRTAVGALADVADVDVVRVTRAPMDDAGRVRYRARLEVCFLSSAVTKANEDRTRDARTAAVATVTPIRRAVAR